MPIGVELISTLLGKVLLGYEHNYIVHAFLYATEKCQGSHTNTDRRLAARETDEREENPIFNAFNSPSLSITKVRQSQPIEPLDKDSTCSHIELWLRHKMGATLVYVVTEAKFETRGWNHSLTIV